MTASCCSQTRTEEAAAKNERDLIPLCRWVFNEKNFVKIECIIGEKKTTTKRVHKSAIHSGKVEIPSSSHARFYCPGAGTCSIALCAYISEVRNVGRQRYAVQACDATSAKPGSVPATKLSLLTCRGIKEKADQWSFPIYPTFYWIRNRCAGRCFSLLHST